MRRYFYPPGQNSVHLRDRFADVGDGRALSGTLASFADKAKEGSLLAPCCTEEKYAWQRGKRSPTSNDNPLVEWGLHIGDCD